MERETKLSAEILEQDGALLVRAHGEVDLHSAPDFEHALQAGVERGGGALIVDLSDVAYVDSAGLSALVAAHRRLSARGAALYVIAPPERPVARVLGITRLDTLFHVCSSLEEAIRQIKHSPPG
ncbi:MAG TPA: STAS domain-containing protein [Armatimonadota bacterium]|nr:STAS domain-containing protein [Armatimonadota bacterium]